MLFARHVVSPQALFDTVVNVGRCVVRCCASAMVVVWSHCSSQGVTMRMMLGSLSGLCTGYYGPIR